MVTRTPIGVNVIRILPVLYYWDDSLPVSRDSMAILLNSHNTSHTVRAFRIGFTLSQATKALRECRGIALLYFRPLH